ncbi:MAG: hypothetical protein M3Z03_00995 [Actinomycetota bacterium]|nr:hypothetical protein [Actinomycetota bacterium]
MSDAAEQPEKSPAEQALEQALDVFVYAPIGLVFEGASLLPTLIEKGKTQVTMARMIGQFAVTQGRTEALKRADGLRDQAADLLGRFAEVKLPGQGSNDNGQRPASAATPATASPEPAPEVPAVTDDGPAVSVGDLAITDYDGLSASHVVNRLAGLSSEELETVRRYEATHRGRKTILSKIAQLQS